MYVCMYTLFYADANRYVCMNVGGVGQTGNIRSSVTASVAVPTAPPHPKFSSSAAQQRVT